MQADFQEPLIASAEYKRAPTARARRARRRDPTTGSRRATGTTPPITTPATRAGPTSAARGLSTARPAPATPCRRSTRSSASCPRSSRRSCGRTPTTTSTTPTTSPTCRGPTKRRLLVRDAARPRRGDHRPLRLVVEPRPVRGGGPGRRTTRPSGRVRGLHRPLHPTSGRPSTGVVYWQLNKGWPTLLWDLYNHDFDQAGQLLRGQEGQRVRCTCSTPTTTAPCRSTTSARRRARACRCRQGLRRRRQAARRPDRARHLVVPGQGVATGVLHPSVPAARRRRRRRRRTSSSCCSRATARSSTATSTGSRPSRTWSTGTRRSAIRRRR